MEEIAYELNQIVGKILKNEYKDKEEAHQAILNYLIGPYINKGSEIKTVHGGTIKIVD